MKTCSFLRLALPIVTLLAFTSPANAQNPDLMLSQAERDSVLKTYDNIFPLLGRKAIERGFDLSKPIGLNILGLTMDQGIDITNLGLSTGDNPVVPNDLFTFGKNTSTASTVSGRLDLWLLPFLNVYGFGGKVQTNTTVELVSPIPFTSSVDQSGSTAGLGLTGAVGFKRIFVSVDVNWSWTDLDKLTETVNGRILSTRVGRSMQLGARQRLTLWAGAMNQKFASETNGSIRLGDAVPPETVDQIRDRLETIDEGEWYQDLSPAQKAVVDQIVEALLNGNADDVTINYHLNKAPTTPWNMLIGGNLDLNKRWSVRAEAGLIGRTSFLLSAVYRLDL